MIGNVYLNIKGLQFRGASVLSAKYRFDRLLGQMVIFTLEITTNSLLRSTFLVLVERVAEKCGN